MNFVHDLATATVFTLGLMWLMTSHRQDAKGDRLLSFFNFVLSVGLFCVVLDMLRRWYLR